MSLLDNIHSPKDLKSLIQEDLPAVAQDIRDFIIKTVSKTGGHLASSLGSVELIIALHYVFDAPKDKIVFDVGHQAYAHKILTGRKDRFFSLRQINGINGFIKPSESIYDTFISGHSGTAISAALGMAVARDLDKQNHKVIAVIGDGTLTGGMAYEAMNNAGHSTKNLIIILNDNKMAISRCVGSMTTYLNKILISPLYNRLKKDIQLMIKKIPAFGSPMANIAERIEEGLKGIIVPGALFENLGFRYFGPVDGHNIKELVHIFKAIKTIEEPVIAHVVTEKGKGYKYAEKEPETFHGTGQFNITTGIGRTRSTVPTYTEVFSHIICKLAGYNPRIIAITAAMAQGTGLEKFRDTFPGRFFDVGIAEQHAVTFAAGLAISGWQPVVAIYSTFLQRSLDQIIIDICLQKLPVIFAIDRAGIVGEDGPTHHGVFDIAYLRHIPNIVIMQPKNENELQHMFYTAVNYNGPIAIRYPRSVGIGVSLDTRLQNIEIGRAELICEGKNGVILALGPMVELAEKTMKILRREGIYLALVNARFIKPLDIRLLDELAENYPYLITMEEHALAGGFGSAVLEHLSGRRPCLRIGIPDRFIPHGKISILKEQLGFSPKSIADRIRKFISKKPASHFIK